MPIRTKAVEAAEARGWTKADLAKRTGLSLSTIYNLDNGVYQPSGKTIDAIMAAFPDLPYERLFVMSADSRKQESPDTTLETAA
jgi:DNA-binding XRE family transcriptional regulator